MKKCKHNYDATLCSVCSLTKTKTLEDLEQELHDVELAAEERRLLAYKLRNMNVPEAIVRNVAFKEETVSVFQTAIIILVIATAVTALIALVIKFFGLGIGAMVLGITVAVYAYFENK